MSQAEALLWAETCSARIDSLKSVLDDSILALKNQNTANTNTAVVALKSMERDVGQGYDQIVDAWTQLRGHLQQSILELENSGDLGTGEGRIMAMREEYRTDVGEKCTENSRQSK